MAITGAFLKLNNFEITKLAEYEIEYAKLWKDADRNMNGDVRASLIGIFPKIKGKTKIADRAKIARLAEILNLPYFTVEYYDTISGAKRTAQFYAGDISISIKERQRELVNEFSFTLIPVSKRR